MGESVGWINLGDGTPRNGVQYSNTNGVDVGVNIEPDGALWGLAWGENIGWINLDDANHAPAARVSDANGDGATDVNDISYVLFRLGGVNCPDGDVNGSGIVDVNDISFVLFRLGQNCP